jgi:Protein of unknown function (DUF2589)
MPVTSVEALELSQLLGALLGSVVDAQAASARATVDFIESVGFEVVDTERRMRTVRMRYTKKDENGEYAEFEVDVPLLALVNVPSLAVKQAVLTFGYDVVTATSGAGAASTTPAATPSSGATALPLIGKISPAVLTGFVRPTTIAPVSTGGTTTTPPVRRSTAVDLVVTLEQQDVPIGIERLFDLAELGITERPAPEPPP